MTDGDKWIKLLRAYGPVPDGTAQEAENVGELAKRCGVPKLDFSHPTQTALENCIPPNELCTLLLTGIAGAGKTSVCLNVIEKLVPLTTECTQDEDGAKLVLRIRGQEKTLTIIYDVTAWRKKAGNKRIRPENVAILEKAAAHALHGGNDAFILAVNDGQMHEIFRALPETCSETLVTFGKNLIRMHSEGLDKLDAAPFLRMINLSSVPSYALMELCLNGILKRPEWKCLEDEKDTNPLFGPDSPIPSNYKLMNSPGVRSRLVTLARIADANGYHLTIRAILILIVNALLGHPKASGGLLKPGAEAARVIVEHPKHLAALHLNLFGYNLREETRKGKMVFDFLGMLHAGEETTTDIDELLIFGKRDTSLTEEYNKIVASTPEDQRNPEFEGMVGRYIRGEVESDEESNRFLEELGHERRRIFLHATDDQIKNHRLWSITVFHHAGEFVAEFLDPIRDGKPVQRQHLRRLAVALNRVWTGLLVEDGNTIFISTGLDTSTSPVSDLLLKELRIHSEPAEFDVINARGLPAIRLQQANGPKSQFQLTMLRFEFLIRVAEGAMPTSFSREAYEDLLSLKQCAVRDLGIQQNPMFLERIDVREGGQIHKDPIDLSV